MRYDGLPSIQHTWTNTYEYVALSSTIISYLALAWLGVRVCLPSSPFVGKINYWMVATILSGFTAKLFETLFHYLETPPVIDWLLKVSSQVYLLMLTLMHIRVLKNSDAITGLSTRFITVLQVTVITIAVLCITGSFVGLKTLGSVGPTFVADWGYYGWMAIALMAILYENIQYAYLSYILIQFANDISKMRQVSLDKSSKAVIKKLLLSEIAIVVCDWPGFILFAIGGSFKGQLLMSIDELANSISVINLVFFYWIFSNMKDLTLLQISSSQKHSSHQQGNVAVPPPPPIDTKDSIEAMGAKNSSSALGLLQSDSHVVMVI